MFKFPRRLTVILAAVGAGEDAVAVKLADVADNSSEDRLYYLDPDDQDRLRAKYAKARLHLGAA